MEYSYYFDLWEAHHSIRSTSSNPKRFIGERGYRHFDGNVELRRDIQTGNHKVCAVLKDADLLAQHRYLPFIRNDLRVRRYRRVDNVALKHHERYATIKNRPIMYAAHKDACIYSFLSFILQEYYEDKVSGEDLEDAVLAYRRIPRTDNPRRNKSNIDFAYEVFQAIQDSESYGLIMVDVSHFFDSLDHKYLQDKWKWVLDVDVLPPEHQTAFKSLTKFRYVFKHEVETTLKAAKKLRRQGIFCNPKDFNSLILKGGLERCNAKPYGIPQGSPVSGMLANLYMFDFDLRIKERVVGQLGGVYRRYSDDILVVVPKENLRSVYQFIKEQISSIKLQIKDAKTEAFVCDAQGLPLRNAIEDLDIVDSPNGRRSLPQYLGFEFSGTNFYLRPSTIAKRFRGKRRLDPQKWGYFKVVARLPKANHIKRQTQQVRRKLRALEKDDQERR